MIDYSKFSLTKLINEIKWFDNPFREKEIFNRLLALITAQSPTYKVYTALLTQTGTNAPVAVVLENTLGGDIIFSREDVGQFSANSEGLFTENKTAVIIFFFSDEFGNRIQGYSINPNKIRFLTFDSIEATTDGITEGTTIEIRVYN